MPTPDLNFRFYMNALLDGTLDELRQPMVDAVGGKGFLKYAGQLDDQKKVAEVLEDLISQAKFPLTVIGYAGGDTDGDGTSAIGGEPRQFRHTCRLPVIVVSNKRDEDERRDQVFQMISVVWDRTTDLRIFKTVEGIDNPVLISCLPFETGEIDRVMLPDMMAYMINLYTAFEWTGPDRTRTSPPTRRIYIEVANSWPVPTTDPRQVPPGVDLEVS